jgi:hypothetical protein
VPFDRNRNFTGRENILLRLHQSLRYSEWHSRVAVYGLGGSGKSAIAIQLAYQIRGKDPGCAVFWISAFTMKQFQESYRDIAQLLCIPGADDTEKDMLDSVRRKLSENAEKWLMIVDNVDDDVLFAPNSTKLGSRRLYDYLPHSRNGMILFTTRSRRIAVELASNDTFLLGKMSLNEATELLRYSLQNEPDLYREVDVSDFLEELTYNPLAIMQTLAFIKANNSSLRRYVELLRQTRRSKTELLQRHFNDPFRANESHNAIIATWYISFQRIQQEDELAAGYLAFLACIGPQNIPSAIFPLAVSEIKQEEALGTLTGYSFLTKHAEGKYYDTHTLIHHAIQEWLKSTNKWTDSVKAAIRWLTKIIPPGGELTQYSSYLIHGLFAANIPEIRNKRPAVDLLNRIGRCYQYLGEYNSAVSAHEKEFQRRK